MSEYDEDDAIEKAKALSLVTAQEDEKRRQHKYGGFLPDLPPSTTDSTGTRTQPSRDSPPATALISRPRPQARGVSREGSPLTVTPSVPPRPDPQRLEQARTSHGHLQAAASAAHKSSPPSTSPSHRASGQPPTRPPPPLPSTTTTKQASPQPAPRKHMDDTPLIMLSPPTKQDLLVDFDLDSLDPLKNTSARKGEEQQPPRPSSAQALFSKPTPSMPHSNSTGSFSSNGNNWAAFGDESKVPSTQTTNSAAVLPYSINPFANTSAPFGFNQMQPFGVTGPPQSNMFGAPFSASSLSNTGMNLKQQTSDPFSNIDQADGFLGRDWPLVSSGSNFGAHQQNRSKLSLSPTFGNQADSTAKMPRIPSDSNIVMTAAKQQAQQSVASQNGAEFKRTPSIDMIEGSRIPSDFGLKVDSENREVLTEIGDDLMKFSDPFGKAEQFLTLESFDPLFTMDKIGDPMTDSTGLFTNPFDKFERKETPNPFPAVNALTTQDILAKVNAMAQPEKPQVKHYNEIDPAKLDAQLGFNQDQSQASAASQASTSEHKRTVSNGSMELLDPFSISDLTSALEKKRRIHAKEQEERKALLRKKEPIKEEKGEKKDEVVVKRRTTDERRKRFSRTSSHLPKGQYIKMIAFAPYTGLQESTYETLQSYNEAAQDEVKAFCDMVARLKLQYPHTHESNNGFYWSPRIQCTAQRNITVKTIITADFMTEPYIFTPPLEVSIDHVICEVLIRLADSLESTTADDYLLKVHGKTEYLLNDSQLGDYEYVHNCLKVDEDIKLVLEQFSSVARTLLRTETDDQQPVLVPKQREIEDPSLRVTRDKLNILTETYYREVEKLRDAAIQAGTSLRVRCKGVVQAVKAICATLYKIESAEIIKGVQRLHSLTGSAVLRKGTSRDRESFVYIAEDGHEAEPEHARRVSQSDIVQLDDLHVALEDLTRAVKGQIDLFCRTFQTDFRFESSTSSIKEKKCVSELGENLLLHLATAHRIPMKWKSTYEEFRVVCSVYYAGQKLCPEVFTQSKPRLAEGLQDTYIWDEWIPFESLYVNSLPRESRLCLQLIGVKAVTSSDVVQRVNTPLGWVVMQLFNHKFELVQGGQLLGLWHDNNMDPTGTSLPSTEWTHSVLLQINLPDFDCDYCYPSVMDPLPGLQQDFNCLHPMDQDQLTAIYQRDATFILTPDTRGYIWEKRHYLHEHPCALPRVLQAAPSWRPRDLREIYSMMGEWRPLLPTDALQLLLPIYPDTFVRTKAVEWVRVISEDEVIDYLPQLIQALKFESYHTSALARMLIEKCILSPRVAHQIYWLLKEAADDIRYRKRYQLMFGALLSVMGEAARKEFGKEEDLVKMLAAISEKVKAAKEKENVLQRELLNMWEFFEHSSTRVPLNPSMLVSGLDVKSCSYFSSNAFPLKLVFKNIHTKAGSIYTMFKSGDDLRQDMLTMQMIRIMDKLWLKDRLDLRMITFRCQATGLRKGFVELVTESDTLRKIQIKHGRGVAGSFKDTTIREWLQIQNPTQLEYEKAVDNFTSSCAGYCVATYLLGICDRHNDNIMVKHSGHLFHIDFGKFLGDSQMFGNIKRDRTPFVLTSDMAYVINGGDKMSQRFQAFIDYCCTAFNILRKHSQFFTNLFQLMVLSGIPGVNHGAVKYVQRALLPDHTDAEATAVFTRMIEESLKSTFTQFNFFIHNLAQMKFSGHAEGALLSFIPKTYSIHTDGKITHIELAGYQKRYNPEKYYIYIIKVERENQKVPSFIFRRYSEFQEIHHKLVCLFPLIRLPSLSNKMIIGRTHIKSVAEERKLELQAFLRDLLGLASEISEHDIVYTFCHPMLRDEQDINKTNIEKLREPPKPRPQLRRIDGQIKLSIFYKHGELTIMIMHVKDLAGLAGNAPDPYVKLYLLPDPFKETKRKTKIAKSTFHPTYNEMLTYRLTEEQVKERTLSVSVWNFDSLKENEYLGSVLIPLNDMDFTTESTRWYSLSQSVVMTASPSPRSPAPGPGMFV